MAKSSWSEDDIKTAGGCLLCALLMLFFAVWIGIKSFGGLNIPYADGSRSGTVTKISKKGWIWQTWEGELDLHRLRSTGGDHPAMTADIFYFSVTSDEIAKEIEEAERRGTRATLHYKQYFMRGWKYGGTSYDITEVEVSELPSAKSASIQ